jgi:hypothetical protein
MVTIVSNEKGKTGDWGSVVLSNRVIIQWSNYEWSEFKTQDQAIAFSDAICDLCNRTREPSTDANPASTILESLISNHEFNDYVKGRISEAIKLLNS